MVRATSPEDSRSILKTPLKQHLMEYMCRMMSGAACCKMKFGQSARNSQGTCSMVEAASPEDGKSLPPSLEEQYRCE